MNARHVPKFHYAPVLPVSQIKPAPLTRKQIALIAIGWAVAMACALFLLTPAGRALLELVWGEA